MFCEFMLGSRNHPLLGRLVLWLLASAGSLDASAAPAGLMELTLTTLTAEPTWRYTSSPAQRRVGPATVKLQTGAVLVIGGYINGSGLPPVTTTEIYHPETDSWSPTSPTILGRYLAAATLLADGRVLMTGGLTSGSNGGSRTASAEIYNPATGTWTLAAPMLFPRRMHASALLPDGRVLVVGDTNTSEIYDVAANTWTAAQPYFSETKGAARLLFLPNGKLLMVCGEWTEEPKLFDPATLRWTSTSPVGTRRELCTATSLPNGKVLITGGYNVTIGWNSPLATAELYDPATNTWSPAAPMSQVRREHAAGLLPDGKVLVAGGYSGSAFLASAEVYDPASGTWQPTASMGWSRASYGWQMLPLSDGHLFVGSDSPELYLPGLGENDLGSALGNAVAQGDTCGRPNTLVPACALSNAPDYTYTWRAPSTGTFTFTTMGSSYDTLLQLTDAATGALLGCNDDAGGTFQSSVTASLNSGQAVLLSVDGYRTRCGAFTLNIGSGLAWQR